MKVAVYIPPTYKGQLSRSLFEHIYSLMEAGIHTSDQKEEDSCIFLNHPASPYKELGISELVEKYIQAGVYPDVLVLARTDHKQNEIKNSYTNELLAIKRAHPHLIIASYASLSNRTNLKKLSINPRFNAHANPVDVAYADAPADPALKKLKIQPYNTRRAFRSLLQAAYKKTIPTPVCSPNLAIIDRAEKIDLGNLSIDTKQDTIYTLNGTPLTQFSRQEARLLGILAAYQGSYGPKDLMMHELYNRTIANDIANARPISVPDEKIIDVLLCKMNQKFNTLGYGPIKNLWGVGRYATADNFILPRDTQKSGKSKRQKPYILWDADENKITNPETGFSLKLSPTESLILNTIVQKQGEITTTADFEKAGYNSTEGNIKTRISHIRTKMVSLYPTTPQVARALIENVFGRGYRMRTPAQVADKLKQTPANADKTRFYNP